MLRHTVLLRFHDSTDDAVLDGIVASLRDLPAAIPEIRSYTVGRDLGLADDNAHLVVCGDFEGQDEYVVYRDHPAHRKVIEEQILPALESRSALQFDLSRDSGHSLS